ncbi:glutamate transport system substrate-binding protein [Actinomadura pelletieri DSM 43383]|uniref:Glutamate transport system substrate-binding protein n=1 Tax=Actinomadura pelletieri DSM 43383 TaxID=1120940 RepID=A0A495QPV6_9ACTN|nr:glutamate ABC transporter substrate-binding protein [Actinomadura pelletieri]RKS74995.1 glutamate transport system substrate-binding protein [Actinomadura pelletieri DSM 43383]
MVQVKRRVIAAPLTAIVLASATACGIADANETSVATKDALVIGVNTDQPGVAERTESGSHEGFDIDIAREIAKRLGVTDVTFTRVTSATREQMIQDGTVDLVVASYSVTPERKVKVSFAGPYYVAHQDVLVRGSDAAIRSIHDLAGRRLCRVPGSVSFPRVHDEQGIAARPVDAVGYSDCLTGLTAGTLDAVSTDDLILAGLAAKASGNGRDLRIVNAPFTDEPYGVGIRKSDVEGCEAVNKAITQMYQDGTAPRLLTKWFAPVGLKVTTTVPQFEGCV